MTFPLWLDHVSVAVPSLAAAVGHLERRLGLRTTITPADPDHHGRVHLDRTYLEVAARPGQTGWSASLFFLRFEDPLSLREHLGTSGLPHRFTEYVGVDGVWDDVEINTQAAIMPILVRRTAPAEVAPHWPPPLTRPHPGPAQRLASVHVAVTDLQSAAAVYRRLLDLPEHGPPESEQRFQLAGGEVVLVHGSQPGIAGIVIEVSSFAEMADYLRESLEPSTDGVAWLDPHETFGLRIGLCES